MNCFTIEMVPYEIAGLMYDLKSSDLPSLFLKLFQHYSLAIFSMAPVSKLWMWVSWFFCPELYYLLVVLCINRCNITCKNIFIILYKFTVKKMLCVQLVFLYSLCLHFTTDQDLKNELYIVKNVLKKVYLFWMWKCNEIFLWKKNGCFCCH